MIVVDVAEAETSLLDLLQKVEAGEEVVITRDGEPVAHIEAVAIRPKPAKKPIDVERLRRLHARMPPVVEDSATAIRRMRDEGY